MSGYTGSNGYLNDVDLGQRQLLAQMSNMSHGHEHYISATILAAGGVATRHLQVDHRVVIVRVCW